MREQCGKMNSTRDWEEGGEEEDEEEQPPVGVVVGSPRQEEEENAGVTGLICNKLKGRIWRSVSCSSVKYIAEADLMTAKYGRGRFYGVIVLAQQPSDTEPGVIQVLHV